jgi:hypothetical protein
MDFDGFVDTAIVSTPNWVLSIFFDSQTDYFFMK